MFRFDGRKYGTIVIKTEPDYVRPHKENPYFGRLHKVSVINAMFCSESGLYAEVINKRLADEGKDPVFIPSNRKWGVRIPGTCLYEHNCKEYVEFLPECAAVSWFLDGKPLTDKSIIDKWVKPYPNAEQGGLDNKVIIRLVKMENVISVKFSRPKSVRKIIDEVVLDVGRQFGIKCDATGLYFDQRKNTNRWKGGPIVEKIPEHVRELYCETIQKRLNGLGVNCSTVRFNTRPHIHGRDHLLLVYVDNKLPMKICV